MIEERTRIDDAPFFRAAGEFGAKQLLRLMRPPKREDICTWVESHIDMSYDQTSSAYGLVHLRPYQVEPLRATEQKGVRQVTLAWSQRTGKSQCWKFSLCKRVADCGISAIISFPSDREVDRAIRDTVKPLLETVPGVSRDWSVRGNVKKDGIHLPSQSAVIYWQGGQQQIISLSANWAAMDEVDFHQLVDASEEGKNFDQIKALKLRMQTHKERMLILCSSVTTPSGAIWTNYLEGSQETWHMRCLNCGALAPTNRLAFKHEGLLGVQFRGLQWDKAENGDIIPSSIRWICPTCGHAHTENCAPEMNRLGDYVAASPSKKHTHRSFQVGALASPDWTWLEIAQAQESATDSDGKKFLANAILSMPYAYTRDSSSAEIEDVNRMRQVDAPPDMADRLAVVAAGIDVQKSELAGTKYYVFAIRGWDEEGNSWQLAGGTANTLTELEERLSKPYYGHSVALALFDHGGFDNTMDVTPYICRHPRYFYYKGTNAKFLNGKDFHVSNDKKIWLANATGYQVKLCDLLYSPPRPVGYAWYLRRDCPEDMFRQLCAVRPNRRMRFENSEAYANWVANDRRDYFDAEKMALCALDIIFENFPASAFAHGHKPAFLVKEKLMELARKKKVTK